MLIDYGSYVYYDGGDTSSPEVNSAEWKKHVYDVDKMNDLVLKRQYKDAFNQARFYHRKDEDEQAQFSMELKQMQDNADTIESLYDGASDDEIQALDFMSYVFQDNGLEQLDEQYSSLGKDENKFSRDLHVSMRTLGMNRNLNIPTKPNSLEFQIPNNGKQEDFFTKLGMTEKALSELDGFSVSHNTDGKLCVKFDKGNPKALEVLYALSKEENSWFTRNIKMSSFDENGNFVDRDSNNMTGGIGYTIDKAKAIIENRKKNLGQYTRQYSTVIGPPMYDWISKLNQQRIDGTIKETEYNSRYTAATNLTRSILKSINLSQQPKVYSNYANENFDDGDFTLRLVTDQEKLTTLENLISDSRPDDIEINAGYSNGQIGTYIVIPAVMDKDNPRETVANKISLFVPGMFYKEVQKKLNSDTRVRSSFKAERMRTRGENYLSSNGKTLINLGDGTYRWEDDKQHIITGDEAERIINKDMIIDSGKEEIVKKYISASGKITNGTSYLQDALNYAFHAANELNPTTPLTYLNNNDITSEQLMEGFKHRSNNGYDCPDFWNTVSKDTYRKITDFYQIYDALLKQYNMLYGY